jgi:hypothetical protein
MSEAGGVRASNLTASRLDVNLFDVDVDSPDFHPHQLFDGAGDRLLHFAADLSGIGPMVQSEVELGGHLFVLDFDLHPLAAAAPKQAIDRPGHRSQARNSRDRNGRELGNPDQDTGGDGGQARGAADFLWLIAHGLAHRHSAVDG